MAGFEGLLRKIAHGACVQPGCVVASSDVALAVSRLRRDFAFVGLTEYFDVSVCLFGAMYGGTFAPANMLQNYRSHVGRRSNRSQLLADYVDKDDMRCTRRPSASSRRRHGHCARGDMSRQDRRLPGSNEANCKAT